MSGTLYLCATPIGNLEDITLRVLATLRDVDLIAAEDTRNSRKLLNRFEIRTPLTSYHEHNKKTKTRTLVKQLQEGAAIALITDAGTPAISDPGEDLVAACHAEGIRVTSLPGATACITALTLSGFRARRFVFEGFLPAREQKKDRKAALKRLEGESRTIVLYSAPHDLVQDLKDLHTVLGERDLALCRELTKKFEEVTFLTLGDEPPAPKGEYVLVIAGTDEQEQARLERAQWETVPIADHVAMYEEEGYDRKEAMKMAAADLHVSKSDVYRALLKTKQDL